MNSKYKIGIGILVVLIAGGLYLKKDTSVDVPLEESDEEVEMVVVETEVEEYLDAKLNLDEYRVDESDMIHVPSFFDTIVILEDTINNDEIEGLIQMREEEKLARDVYDAMYDKWGLSVFTNISASEQTHTDTIKYLLDKYEVDDPVMDDERGVFTSPVYFELYNQLVAKGEVSLSEALIVGVTIEDLDIFDLEELLIGTVNLDIISAYENLIKGSRNHMRAFIRLLDREGGIYEAQYLSQEEIDEIVSAQQERGRI